LRPEDLLLGILVRRVREGGLVHDAETLEPLLHLGGGHGTAVIGQQGAGQPAFLEGLREAVDEGLGALGQVPLQMAAQARALNRARRAGAG